LHFNADVFEGPEFAVEAPTLEGKEFLEAVTRGVVDRVALRDALELDDTHLRSQSQDITVPRQ
jgi:hypothetical protein